MRPGHGRPVVIGLSIAAFTASGATAAAVPLDTSSVSEATGVDVPQLSAPQVEAPQVEVPQVQAPQVQAPRLPSAPSVPSTPSVPSGPSAPDVGGVLESAPSLSSPQTAPSSPSAGTLATAGGQASASSGGAEAGSGTGGGERAQGQQARAAWRADRFEAEVKKLRGCLAALTATERQVASLRAGVPFGRPMSRAEVARHLDISRKLARQLERSALNSLRAAARADRCGPGEPPAFTAAPLAMKGSLETITATRASGTSVASGEGGDSGDDGRSSGTNVVASVFDQGPGMAGLAGSLLVENPSVSAVAVGFGVLLITAAALHVHRRRAALVSQG